MGSQPVVHVPLVVHKPLSGSTFGVTEEKDKNVKILPKRNALSEQNCSGLPSVVASVFLSE